MGFAPQNGFQAAGATSTDGLTDTRTGEPLSQTLDGLDAEIAALTTRLSADEVLLTAAGLAITDLKTARDAHAASIATAQTSIAALQTAVASLQGHATTDEAAIAAAQAAITALQGKVAADEATAAALAATVGNLATAQTADEAKIAANAADVASLKASRTADEAAIAAAQTAISALQQAKTTDEQAIAANAAAIAALQTAMTSAQSAISANGTAIASLQSSRTADEASIASNSAAITALQARPVLPAGSTEKAGQVLTIQSDGSWAPAAAAAPPAPAASGGGIETFVSTFAVKNSNTSFNLAAVVPTSAKGNKATIVVIRCVGAGGSGFATDAAASIYPPGGNPGQVTRLRKLLSSLPSSGPVTIGQGAPNANGIQTYANAIAGGDTSFFGILTAKGGPGGYLVSGYPPPQQIQGDVPSGRPGVGGGNGNATFPADALNGTPGDGPGAGGGGLLYAMGGQYSGRGGDANVNVPGFVAAGGGPGSSGDGGYNPNGNGADGIANNLYGGGGAGASYYRGFGYGGGFPGGAGGGGAIGGTGGNGVVYLDFYVVE